MDGQVSASLWLSCLNSTRPSLSLLSTCAHLSLQHLLSSHADSVRCCAQDVVPVVKGVAADVSHVDTPAVCTGYVKDELKEALKGSDIVVIPAGVPRKVRFPCLGFDPTRAQGRVPARHGNLISIPHKTAWYDP